MSKTFYKLSGSDFFQDWSNTSLITTSDDWSGVESIVGYRGDGLASSGRDPRLVTADSTVIDVNANATNPATNTTGGVTEFQIADPVVALQGSGTAQAPNLVLYLDASGRQDLRFSVDLRDIDGSNDNAIQQVTIQYRIGDSGAWINVPGGYVADASTGPALASNVTHLDLLLPAAVNNQSQVEIRILTADAVGSDEWIGVDNLRVTSQAMAQDHTPPQLTASSPVDGAVGIGQNANLTLNFNELVAAGSGKITISDGAGDVRIIDVLDASQVSISGQSLVINPTDTLHTGTTYHVSVDAGAVVDMAGNAWAGTGANPVDFSTIAELTRIYEIQGAGHRSAYEGQLVNTRGVVTAIDTSGTKGFWIQDQQGDGNDATSDAVFVFAPNSIGAVKVGDLVKLQGTVVEFAGSDANNLTTTEVSNLQELTVLSSGNTVQATIIGEGGRLPPTEAIDSDNFAVFNPDHDGIDFYESLEGMLVTARNVQVVDDTYKNATYVVTDQGAHATGMNDRGGITHSGTDANPERIEIYTDGGVAPGSETTVFETGDLLGDVTGVVSYYGGNYELIPTSTPTVQGRIAISSDTTTLEGDTAHLTVGAYNMANLDPNDAQSKFDALAYDIVKSMGTPDILGIEEVQDSNGTGTGVLSADVTINKLLDAIVAAGGPRYSWVTVDPTAENANGGEPNGNIRNVILYDASRVSYVEGSVKLIADNTPANGDSFYHSRKPLTADFMFHGEEVTFVSIHNYSRLGSDEMYGVHQPPEASGDARRTDQTAAVRDFVHQLMLANPDANVVIGGDFNGYQYETSLTQLEASGEIGNLVWKLTATDRYSSTFEGNNEQIDHMLVSSNLYATALFDNVHVNTNLPYDLGPSDHDAVLSQLLINHGPVAAGDAYGGDEDLLLAVDALHGVLADDTDPNHDTMSVALVSGPAHGTLELHADGSFEYHASANYNGADSFSYVAKDAFGGASAVTQVQLTVAAVNDAPVAATDSAAVAEDASILIDVLANDSDVDGDALAIVLAGAKSALGASLVVENGKVRYVADADSFDQLAAGQSVIDTFTYSASDGHGGVAPVTVSVKVLEAGDNLVVAGSNKSGIFIDTAGHDTTYTGGNGDDVVFGMDGADTLYGGNGTDVLFGGAGADFLSGDNGVDILVGGAGFDTLSGGNGADMFVVTADSGTDKLLDFRPVLDKIVVGYTGSDSAADVSAWAVGAHAADGFAFADVDVDGNGSVDAVGITGGALGTNTVLLGGWTVATLVGQGYLTADHHVRGGWMLAVDAPVVF